MRWPSSEPGIVHCGSTDVGKAILGIHLWGTSDLVLPHIPSDLPLELQEIVIAGWFGIKSLLISDCVNAVAH